MEKEKILKQMGRKLVDAIEPEKAKKVLPAVHDGGDICDEILGIGAA